MTLTSSDLRTASWRTALVLGALLAGWAAPARATIVLEVDVESGDLKLVGQAGDTFSSYTIYSASNDDSLLYTNWNADRFGGTPVGGSSPTSVALGYGMWHSMGTVTPPTGQATTTQLGEMSAVYAGYATNGSPNANTSKSFAFTAGGTVIDLGDHFVPGSPNDLVFGYGPTPGFMNGWIFDGTTHSYTIATAGSYYQGETFSAEGVVSSVDYVPEPGTAALLASPLLLLLLTATPRNRSTPFGRCLEPAGEPRCRPGADALPAGASRRNPGSGRVLCKSKIQNPLLGKG
nr:hypothetical protein [uncultured Rhodopila sp.]